MHKHLNKSYLFFTILAIVITIVSCQSESTSSELEVTEDMMTNENFSKHNAEEAKKIFIMMPSPIETASLLKKAGAEYDKNILNPIENVSKYDLTRTRAINLGIYAADLSVASVFEQTQESVFFISNCKKLADALGLSEAFNNETVERIEANINDKDSLMRLISNTYWETDNYLQQNEKASLSALIISGGWVEGLYIATQLQQQSGSDLLKKRIAEQKFSLNHLLEILVNYKKEPDISAIYTDLLDLYDVFSKIKSVKLEQSDRTNVIGAEKELQITDEELAEITKKITEIRNNFINS